MTRFEPRNSSTGSNCFAFCATAISNRIWNYNELLAFMFHNFVIWNKFLCWWIDLNCVPSRLEATALPMGIWTFNSKHIFLVFWSRMYKYRLHSNLYLALTGGKCLTIRTTPPPPNSKNVEENSPLNLLQIHPSVDRSIVHLPNETSLFKNHFSILEEKRFNFLNDICCCCCCCCCSGVTWRNRWGKGVQRGRQRETERERGGWSGQFLPLLDRSRSKLSETKRRNLQIIWKNVFQVADNKSKLVSGCVTVAARARVLAARVLSARVLSAKSSALVSRGRALATSALELSL